MKRGRYPAACRTGLLLLACGGCAGEAPERPNIILMLVDTLRADHLGAYGFEGPISPRMDGLAGESVLLDNCFATAPWTPPSMGSLFTSRHPQVHGLNAFHDHRFVDPDSGRLRISVLPDDAVTLAEALRDSGYRTAGFVANVWLRRRYGLGQGFDDYDDRTAGRIRTAEAIVEAASAWLDSTPNDAPFFLYLHFMDVHEPYFAPREDFQALERSPSFGQPRRLDEDHLPPRGMEVRPLWADDSMRRELRYWRARYASGVRAWDRRVSGFLKTLRRSGLLAGSWLVVTSDHGEELFEHGGWGHGGSLFDHQLHVPLIVRAPGGRGGGRRIADLVSLIDLMPSLLALSGAKPPAGMQGRDVSPLLFGNEVEPPAAVFSAGVLGNPAMAGARTKRHKVVHDRETGRVAVFDLSADPHERRDVGGVQTDAAGDLRAHLADHLQRLDRWDAEPRETVEIPEEMVDRLKALGYLR